MTKGLLIGAAFVGGIFVGFVTYEVAKKKGPKLLATAKKKASNIGKRTSEIVTEAKRAFSEGFASAQDAATA
ncbi:hypothetical protein ES703_58288 [subsurface metagenome]